MLRYVRQAGTALILSAAVLACRDPESGGMARGPVKAPGDSVPLLLIAKEEGTAMRDLGEPNRPRGEELEFPEVDTTAAAAPAEQQPTAQVPLPEGVTQAMVDEGKQIFGTTCFACHGANGTGGPLAPALNDKTWLNIDGSYNALIQVITNGVPQPKQHPAAMPPKGGASINEAQVRAVAAYVYTISR